MTPKAIVLTLAAGSAAGLIAGTQWVGYSLGYPAALGWGIVTNEHVIYPPWALVHWSIAYRHVIPDILHQGHVLTVGGFVVGLLAVGMLKRTQPRVAPVGTHGWAGARDIKRSGLMTRRGVVVGQYQGKILTYNGPEHQLVAGATRSGKGVGHVIPTLLNWPGSVVVYDVKGELWEKTACFRSTFGRVLRFNPTQLDSAHYNPLLAIRKGPQEIRDTQNVVDMLVDPNGIKQERNIWDQKAAEFLVGVILHVLYTQPLAQKNLGTVRNLIMRYNRTCQEMQYAAHCLDKKTGLIFTHPEVQRVAQDILSKYDKFRDSVAVTAGAALTLYADPIVTQNTSQSDLAISDLMCGDRPLSLYLQPPPSDADRLRPLMRLMLNQITRNLMEAENICRGRLKRHRLLLLLDEFPTLGRMGFFEMTLRTMASYGIKAHLIVQSFNDIIEAYGQNNTILDNCHVIVTFASSDPTTQTKISQLVGMTTEYRTNYSQIRTLLPSHTLTESMNEQTRLILHPGDIRQLPLDQQLIFVGGYKPMRTEKVHYYKISGFMKRVKPAPQDSLAPDSPRTKSDWDDELPRGRHWDRENCRPMPGLVLYKTPPPYRYSIRSRPHHRRWRQRQNRNLLGPRVRLISNHRPAKLK